MGLDSDRYIGHTLVRMYGGCDSIGLARKVFDEIPVRDVVSWSAMIAGYVACDAPLDAFKLFRDMRRANEKPNSVTLVSLLSACTKMLDIDVGESLHSYIIANSIAIDAALGTVLLEMYSKCGHVEKAFQVFDYSMCEKNLQSWTVMISALADHGRGKEAIFLFNGMQRNGLKPDSMLYAAILSACSHLGLVEEGQWYFDQMVRVYAIKPRVEHYGCIVDMLGRAGLIEEAYQVIKSMPMEPNSVIIRSFLGASRNSSWVICSEDELGKLLLKSEPHLGANYVLAAGMSSLSGQWKDAADLRVVMRRKGLKKVPGCSWVKI